MYKIDCGTVQSFVSGFSKTPYIHHFGRAEYDRDKPILTESLRSQAQPIVDMLNAGTITEIEAKKLLDKIRW